MSAVNAPVKNDTFIPTRASLLKRLKNWEDQESWREFFALYGRLIFGVAIKAGLTKAEAQDVVQDTAVVVARKLPGFAYDPAIGSFKSWLLLITRRRIENSGSRARREYRAGLRQQAPHRQSAQEGTPKPKSNHPLMGRQCSWRWGKEAYSEPRRARRGVGAAGECVRAGNRGNHGRS